MLLSDSTCILFYFLDGYINLFANLTFSLNSDNDLQLQPSISHTKLFHQIIKPKLTALLVLAYPIQLLCVRALRDRSAGPHKMGLLRVQILVARECKSSPRKTKRGPHLVRFGFELSEASRWNGRKRWPIRGLWVWSWRARCAPFFFHPEILYSRHATPIHVASH